MYSLKLLLIVSFILKMFGIDMFRIDTVLSFCKEMRRRLCLPSRSLWKMKDKTIVIPIIY